MHTVNWRGCRRCLEHALVYALLTFGAVLALAPLVWMGLASFKPTVEVMAYPPQWITPGLGTLRNYQEAWRLIDIPRVYFNSGFTTLIQVLGTLVFSALVAYGLTRFQFPGRDIVFTVCLLTMMIPSYVILIPLYIMVRNLNLTNTYLGLILPGLMTPFAIFLLRQHFLAVPSDLVDAAYIDGSGDVRTLFSLVVPISKAGVSTVIVFTAMGAWNAFLWPSIVVNEERMFTIPIAVTRFYSQFAVDWGAVMAFTTISTAPILIVYFIFQRQFVEGMAMSGLKG
ncbi:MAG: carbohydrate ABC transporter permease [Chloroflexi bacterium]|nr:carbohydrate ABC transporter permease [Chloroflexota bacterium]